MNMKKFYFAALIPLMLILSACQESDRAQSENLAQPEHSNSEPINSHVQNNESSGDSPKDKPSSSNDSNFFSQDIDIVKEKRYSNEKEAVNAIENYYEIGQTNLDLGHGIKGFAEGAAGHQYISWKEGNWLIEINFPTDPVYAIDNYENAESMAKSIVNYLEEHFLPPPDQRGKIQINGFREHPETIVQWQKGNKVYTIDQKTADPFETLQLTVEQSNKQ
ncbi:hypothetical protein ACTHOQ_07915 [Solibacillus silvestris]|uniref:hypothetical protein n=1 Tax=Solibacillus silvestris TaxID=76853 RepID=UPI003F7FF43C